MAVNSCIREPIRGWFLTPAKVKALRASNLAFEPHKVANYHS
jgi:hypothetical protein